MIQVTGLEKELGARILFNDVTFALSKNERVGFVGRNGSGKSTLFKILMGEMEKEAGDISIPKNYSIGFLKQYIEFTKNTVLEECMQVLAADEKFDNYKAEKILFGLGFSEEDLAKNPLSFSGGFQIRINLTKVLLENHNLLLLDEPTNYLDIVSMRWLEGFLSRYPGEIILITHDRGFMDKVCTHTMGLHRQKLVKIKGNFLKYKTKIEEEEIVYENTRLNQEKKRKEIEAFVTKFKAKASKANQAQSRQKMLEKMEEIEALENVRNLDFKFNYKEFQAKTFLKARDLSFGYSMDKILFDKLDFYINSGEKIAVIGKNGKGKSTLLNLIAKKLKPVTGNVELHPSVSIGHFGQTNIQVLHPDNTIEEEINSVNAQLGTAKIRSICGTMMFTGDDAKKKIKVLSGGEKSRVLLGKILAKETNLLLLDEPTNHLDQESINELTNQLEAFKGACVVVTHNELMLKSFATKFIVFQKDSCSEFLGTYDEFLEKVGWEDEVLSDSDKKQEERQVSKLSHKEYKHQRSEMIKERAKATRPLRSVIEKIEDRIMKCEEKIENANQQLITASESEDGESIVKYSKVLADKEAEVEVLFLELEEKTENLSLIEADYEDKLNSLN
jgi:ATP-binding cassette subfamily F protein 3